MLLLSPFHIGDKFRDEPTVTWLLWPRCPRVQMRPSEHQPSVVWGPGLPWVRMTFSNAFLGSQGQLTGVRDKSMLSGGIPHICQASAVTGLESTSPSELPVVCSAAPTASAVRDPGCSPAPRRVWRGPGRTGPMPRASPSPRISHHWGQGALQRSGSRSHTPIIPRRRHPTDQGTAHVRVPGRLGWHVPPPLGSTASLYERPALPGIRGGGARKTGMKQKPGLNRMRT